MLVRGQQKHWWSVGNLPDRRQQDSLRGMLLLYSQHTVIAASCSVCIWSIIPTGLGTCSRTSEASADCSTAGVHLSCLTNQAVHVCKLSNAAFSQF